MDPARWQQVREVFHAVIEAEPAAREALLAEAGAADARLRREVERLLARDAESDGLFAGDAAPLAAELLRAAPGEPPGRRLGLYELESEIGRGGMGVVYLGRRTDDLGKRVAVKLIRRGMDSADAVRRFHRERQILARLEHPGIAQVFDGGVTDEGLPFFVMEYVDGLPIDAYCDRHRLATGERLRLFLKVCDSVQYAHRHLVAHRDLKPSNILVHATGQPKLLDFGIAKLLEPDTTEPTLTLERRLTPEYASPEQVRGLPVTAASDVYSLGALLYRLLTGHLPHRLAGRSLAEMERAICHQEPPRPSTVVAQAPATAVDDVSRCRDGTPEKLRRRLAGDVDAIVLRALRKEPEQRYASVEELAGDVRRHLGSLPVLARRGSFAYRANKFLRRHKVAVTFVALLTAFAAAMTFLSLTTARALDDARAALSLAERERRTAQETTEFLVDLFASADPWERPAGELTARALLQTGAERVASELAGEPEVQATLQHTMGEAFFGLGLYPEAESVLTPALATRRRLHGDAAPEVADSLDVLGRLRREQGDLAAAERLIREGLALRQRLFGNDHVEVAESLTNLGRLQLLTGDYAGAETALSQALALRQRLLGARHRQTAESLNNLATLHLRRGDQAAAEALLRQATDFYEAELGPGHPAYATTLHNLVLALDRRGDPGQAEILLRQALARQQERLGNEHPVVAGTLRTLAGILTEGGRYAEAEPLLRQALELHRRRLGGEHASVAGDLHDLGMLLQRQGGRIAEAETVLRQAIDLRRTTGDKRGLATSLLALGSLRLDAGHAGAAEAPLREGLALRRQGGSEAWQVAVAEGLLGASLVQLGRLEEAEPLVHHSYAELASRLGAENRFTSKARERLAAWCRAARQTSSETCAPLLAPRAQSEE